MLRMIQLSCDVQGVSVPRRLSAWQVTTQRLLDSLQAASQDVQDVQEAEVRVLCDELNGGAGRVAALLAAWEEGLASLQPEQRAAQLGARPAVPACAGTRRWTGGNVTRVPAAESRAGEQVTAPR